MQEDNPGRAPLFGLRILVTRAADQADDLSKLLRQAGALPVEFPLIATVPPADTTSLDKALGALSSFAWVIFTSANGVRAVLTRLRELGVDADAFGPAMLCAVGPATAGELARAGLSVDLMPEEYVAESILAAIGEVAGSRILLPKADIAREKLAVELRRQGAAVEEVTAYRTVLPGREQGDKLRNMLIGRQLDVLTFTSSSTVKNFVELTLPGLEPERPQAARHAELQALLGDVAIACIGPVTAVTAEELGLGVDILAEEYTMPGLVQAILRWQERREKNESPTH